jgi:transcription antitermination factor NusG
VIQPATLAGTGLAGDDLHWFAVQTRARHEKVVAERLDERGITSFLPLVKVLHRWSDRRKTVESPLFSCYVFAKLAATSDQRFRTLTVNGVLALVGPGGRGAPIPDQQIESVRKVVQEQMPCQPYPFLKIGQRARIRGGALEGVEGVLVSQKQSRTFVVSVDAIQRSLAVRIEGYDLELV